MLKRQLEACRAEVEKMIESGMELTNPLLIEKTKEFENLWAAARRMHRTLEQAIDQGADLCSSSIVSQARTLEDMLITFEPAANA